MITKERDFDSELDRIAADAGRLFAQLSNNPIDGKILVECLDQLRDLLDCMVLGTVEHGLAVLRIRNAIRFVASEEFGAAKYEIRLLKGGLKDQLTTHVKQLSVAPSKNAEQVAIPVS